MGEIVAVVSQYSKSPRASVILYGELLNTCKEIISNFVFFVCLIDEVWYSKGFMDGFELKIGHIKS